MPTDARTAARDAILALLLDDCERIGKRYSTASSAVDAIFAEHWPEEVGEDPASLVADLYQQVGALLFDKPRFWESEVLDAVQNCRRKIEADDPSGGVDPVERQDLAGATASVATGPVAPTVLELHAQLGLNMEEANRLAKESTEILRTLATMREEESDGR